MEGVILVLLWCSVIGALAQTRQPWGPLAALAFVGLSLAISYWPGIHWL
jgi:hypothetical protein